MTKPTYFWKAWKQHGGEPVSPDFGTPKEAGEWRRDNPQEHITLFARFWNGHRWDTRPPESEELFAAMEEFLPMSVER